MLEDMLETSQTPPTPESLTGNPEASAPPDNSAAAFAISTFVDIPDYEREEIGAYLTPDLIGVAKLFGNSTDYGLSKFDSKDILAIKAGKSQMESLISGRIPLFLSNPDYPSDNDVKAFSGNVEKAIGLALEHRDLMKADPTGLSLLKHEREKMSVKLSQHLQNARDKDFNSLALMGADLAILQYEKALNFYKNHAHNQKPRIH